MPKVTRLILHQKKNIGTYVVSNVLYSKIALSESG